MSRYPPLFLAIEMLIPTEDRIDGVFFNTTYRSQSALSCLKDCNLIPSKSVKQAAQGNWSYCFESILDPASIVPIPNWNTSGSRHPNSNPVSPLFQRLLALFCPPGHLQLFRANVLLCKRRRGDLEAIGLAMPPSYR